MKAPIAQSSALPGNAQDFAIGAFIGLRGYQKTTKGLFGLGSHLTPRATRNAMEHFPKPPALATPPWAESKDIGEVVLANFKSCTCTRGEPAKEMRQEKVLYGPGLRAHEEASSLLIGKANPFK
jgi:hypothetical protein